VTALGVTQMADRLHTVAIPRYPEVRHRDAFDRDYLLDVAAAATARTSPGSLPACWPLLDSREHVEAICRDYGELAAESSLAEDQLDAAKRRATAAERARDEALTALAQVIADVVVERAKHAMTTELLIASLREAVQLEAANARLRAGLAAAREVMLAMRRRCQQLRVALVVAEVRGDLDRAIDVGEVRSAGGVQ
jgi:hypothetical protein